MRAKLEKQAFASVPQTRAETSDGHWEGQEGDELNRQQGAGGGERGMRRSRPCKEKKVRKKKSKTKEGRARTLKGDGEEKRTAHTGVHNKHSTRRR